MQTQLYFGLSYSRSQFNNGSEVTKVVMENRCITGTRLLQNEISFILWSTIKHVMHNTRKKQIVISICHPPSQIVICKVINYYKCKTEDVW